MKRNSIVQSRCGAVCFLALFAILMIVAPGCGTEDWQRDILSALVPGAVPLPLPLPLPGTPGPAGPPGADGAPGPNIIIARAVVNADGTLVNTDDIAVVRTGVGTYELTVDVTGDVLPAGTTEDSFECFLTIKDGSDAQQVVEAFYVPVSLVGTTLRIDVIFSNGDGRNDRAFSVQVILPAG